MSDDIDIEEIKAWFGRLRDRAQREADELSRLLFNDLLPLGFPDMHEDDADMDLTTSVVEVKRQVRGLSDRVSNLEPDDEEIKQLALDIIGAMSSVHLRWVQLNNLVQRESKFAVAYTRLLDGL